MCVGAEVLRGMRGHQEGSGVGSHLTNRKISTPGQDTREDGHATADTPGTGLNCLTSHGTSAPGKGRAPDTASPRVSGFNLGFNARFS